MRLPAGTVTFLFTDIEGSTRLWEEWPDTMSLALNRHNEIVRGAIEGANGYVFHTAGDSFCAAFERAEDAVAAAVDSQIALNAEPWPREVPIRVRMAVHTGPTILDESARDYVGPTLNRVARLRDTGHGGQTLVSKEARDLCGDSVQAGVTFLLLGETRLKDLGSPAVVYQVCHPELPADFPPLRSLSDPARPHNLPHQLTSFIGRERELKDVLQLLDKSRLITLTGAGGMGKSRLALQAAAERLCNMPDGVWLAELAAVTDAYLVPQAVARAMGIREEAGKPIEQTLVEQMRPKKLLLILDNCEHLVDACARLAYAIIRAGADVVILATSREPLGIAGEMTYVVPPLMLPDTAKDATPESLSRFESARLFVDRASLALPGFRLTPRNARAVASACSRLDGIPLAIELAAARVRNLSVEEVNKKLDQRFRLLTGGSRTALPRQQTLKALIDWSYDLLSEQERGLLCRLSVFVGGWSLEAAEDICTGEGIEPLEVLDLLSGLTDKSMVVAEPCGNSMRYRLLETVRQYARDRLDEASGADRWRDLHLAHFAGMAGRAEVNLAGPGQQEWLESLERERGNINAAIRWAPSRDPLAGLRLGGAIWRYWYVRGHFAEGRALLMTLLAAVGAEADTAERASALTGAGVMAYCQGDYAGSRALFEEGLAIRRRLDDPAGVASLLNNLGNVAYDQGEYAEARDLFEESLGLRRRLGEERGVAASLNNLGNVLNEMGDLAAARRLFEESCAIKRRMGDRWGLSQSVSNLGLVAFNQGDLSSAGELFEESRNIRCELGDRGGAAISLNNLGNVALARSDHAAAAALFRESLAIKRELGDRWGIAFSLEGVAAAEAGLGHPLEAARLWGAAEALRTSIGAPLPLNDRARHEQEVANARALFDNEAPFDDAWSQGRDDPLEDAVRAALLGTGESE